MSEFSQNGFWMKLLKVLQAAGRELVEKAIVLYLVLIDPGTPGWAKAEVAAALAYFVSPIDAVPDVIPVVGYTDDLVVLGAALGAVIAYVTPAIIRRARMIADWLFGGEEVGDVA